MSNVDDLSAERVGATLRDKWVLEELLGVGGMASVYAARHKIGRRDAIKILHQKIASSEELRARFEQEAHAVNAFRHPGVVEIRDVDTTEDGAPFLVMELLEGRSLAQDLERRLVLPTHDVLEIGAQVLDVLAAAHERGIIHRDIKPDNLFLVGKEGLHVKVLDFGIARVRSADKRALTTKAGVTLGTMAYMAPEQARGEEIDGRADIYAIGATMFRMMVGRLVHDPDSQAALVMKVIAFDAPRLVTMMPNVDPWIASVVDRALAFEPADRYPDAKTMLADVRAVLGGKAPPYASRAAPIKERPKPSSSENLFGEGDSAQGKPTVVPPARHQILDVIESAATQVGSADIDLPSPALPSDNKGRVYSAPTRLSPAQPMLSSVEPSLPESERVVIVPSHKEQQIHVQPTQGEDIANVTIRGIPATPPHEAGPNNPPQALPPMASPPQAQIVVTPFGELSTLVKRSGATSIVLAIGACATLLALVLLIVTIVWFTSSSSSSASSNTDTPGDPTTRSPLETPTTTASETKSAPLPPPRTPTPTPTIRSRH